MRGRVGFLLFAACASVSACGGGSTSSAATSSTTPSKAAEVAAVKAAVTAFIQAYAKSEETGDAKPVEALTVPGSKAAGDSGDFASGPVSDGVGFKTIRLDIDPGSWVVEPEPQRASVHVTWSAYGYDVSYPADIQVGTAHQSKVFRSVFDLQFTNKTWLVDSFS